MPYLSPLVTSKIEPEKEAVGQDEVIDRHRSAGPVEDRLLKMRLADLVITEPRPADGQAELVEGEVLSDLDGEGQRDDLQVERPGVTGRHLVESVAVVRNHPGEDVNPSGRALGVRLAPQSSRQVESLLQLNEVGAARFEHGPVTAEIDLVEDVVLQLPFDRIGSREKAAADANARSPRRRSRLAGCTLASGMLKRPASM